MKKFLTNTIDNKIGLQGAKVIANAIEINNALCHIYISGEYYTRRNNNKIL